MEHGVRGGYDIRPGNTAQFLRGYRRFLERPGSRLRLVASSCPSCPACQYDDVAEVRDALQSVLCLLPPRPRAELRQLLSGLDTEFRRRTLPDLDPDRRTDRSGDPHPWWHRRLYEGG
ncbi:hypothetical protein [Embleya sp. NBC_00896]|uniref:hypothetical protein n=1 Tax=Embleya sp. NBC_00896 TaxID=2975961 RepID=UPI00386EECF4|nr:hypothetical protein OG928_35655 [Embleya sp. NBC_00896]